MKNIQITIKGKSQFAYIAFYDAEILGKLNEIEDGEFDLLDFIQEHSKYDEKCESVLGHGFCMEYDPIIKVCNGGTELYNGKIYQTEYDGDISKMKTVFKQDYGVEYDDVISNGDEEMLGVDSCFFSNANKYKYCSLEKVECIESISSIDIEVEDDFRLTDLKIIFTCMDDGAEDSITQNLYQETGFENQVFGIKYKGVFYRFGGQEVGGGNEFFWYENNNNSWAPSSEISSRIEELCDWGI
jgi:hypothetical protein